MASHQPITKSWRELISARAFFSCGSLAVALLLLTAGCYERNLAPEIEYSPDDVKMLSEEIDKMEWD